MKELRLKYPVPMMRRIMNVSASGYYAWVDRPLSKRAQEEVRLELEIRAAHQRTRQTYGPERLQRDLAEHGVRVGVCRIKRIRQKLGIRCKQKRRFKTTTNSAHRLPVADNLLGQQFKVSQPNAVWVSDITCIPTDEGWLYLAGHKDLFTGELVGYAMGERMTRNLVSQSLFRALRAKRPARGLMHHSDRGSQYCSQEYRNLMERSGLRSSMSWNGNCFDNAPMESFWGTLKQELVHHRHYRSRQEAIRDITEYIEIFYNRQRRQARLGFLSPAAFQQKILCRITRSLKGLVSTIAIRPHTFQSALPASVERKCSKGSSASWRRLDGNAIRFSIRGGSVTPQEMADCGPGSPYSKRSALGATSFMAPHRPEMAHRVCQTPGGRGFRLRSCAGLTRTVRGGHQPPRLRVRRALPPHQRHRWQRAGLCRRRLRHNLRLRQPGTGNRRVPAARRPGSPRCVPGLARRGPALRPDVPQRTGPGVHLRHPGPG